MTRLLILGMGDTAIGLGLLLQSPERTSGPAYSVIKTYMPLPLWGALLLTVGLLLLITRQVHGYLPARPAARAVGACGCLGASWTVVWSVALLVAISQDLPVSYTGPLLWFFFGTIPHLALAFGREG